MPKTLDELLDILIIAALISLADSNVFDELGRETNRSDADMVKVREALEQQFPEQLQKAGRVVARVCGEDPDGDEDDAN